MNCYLLGKHLPYSYSNRIHNLLSNNNYFIKEINEDELESFMSLKSFRGLNVTIPYKKEVIKYLNEKDEIVSKTNVCNTIVNESGKLIGYNTDYFGFLEMINYYHVDVNNKVVLILGTGATSKTISLALKSLNVKNIYYCSTSNELYSYDLIDNYKDEIDIIINSTPYNTYPNNKDESLVDITIFNKLETVIDVIYNPYKTSLLVQANRLKKKAINGLYMLIAQAYYSECYFLNKNINKEIINKIYKKVLLEKTNIVLVGMPTCGKTLIGKKLAIKLKKNHIDTDDLITSRLNMPIDKYLTKDNEVDFRKLESSIIHSLNNEYGKVISTGGGVILSTYNMFNLASNGIIIYINKDLDNLFVDKSRPLITSIEELNKTYNNRHHLYLKESDIVINCNDNKKIVKMILDELERL